MLDPRTLTHSQLAEIATDVQAILWQANLRYTCQHAGLAKQPCIVGLKLAGASGEAFLPDVPHEHAVSITNPRSDTIHVLLTQKDPTPPAAIGYLCVHDCPVGAFGAKGSAYAKLHELRAREIGTGQ